MKYCELKNFENKFTKTLSNKSNKLGKLVGKTLVFHPNSLRKFICMTKHIYMTKHILNSIK